jgi:hypothetical protein
VRISLTLWMAIMPAAANKAIEATIPDNASALP